MFPEGPITLQPGVGDSHDLRCFRESKEALRELQNREARVSIRRAQQSSSPSWPQGLLFWLEGPRSLPHIDWPRPKGAGIPRRQGSLFENCKAVKPPHGGRILLASACLQGPLPPSSEPLPWLRQERAEFRPGFRRVAWRIFWGMLDGRGQTG